MKQILPKAGAALACRRGGVHAKGSQVPRYFWIRSLAADRGPACTFRSRPIAAKGSPEAPLDEFALPANHVYKVQLKVAPDLNVQVGLGSSSNGWPNKPSRSILTSLSRALSFTQSHEMVCSSNRYGARYEGNVGTVSRCRMPVMSWLPKSALGCHPCSVFLWCWSSSSSSGSYS